MSRSNVYGYDLGRSPDPHAPCRKLPRGQQCDRDGLGGFMGHTCYATLRMTTEERLSRAGSRLQGANQELDAAEREYRLALEAVENLPLLGSAGAPNGDG